MTTEQLVSFINYQIGQKQGWESLGQVVALVNNQEQLVAQAKAQVTALEAQVLDMKASLDTMEETAKVKADELARKAKAKADQILQDALGAVETAKARQQALLKEIVDLEASQVASRGIADKLSVQIAGLQRQKDAAEGDYQGTLKKIKDLKSSL